MQFDERRYRPLSTVDLFDEAFDLYKRNFVLFLSIIAIVIVPSTILSDVYSLRLVNAMAGRLDGIDLQSDQMPATITTLSNFVQVAVTEFITFYAVMLIPWTLAFMALTAAVSSRYLGRPITLVSAYMTSFRNVVSGVIATLLFTLALNLGAVVAAFGLIAPDLAPFLIFVGILVELLTSIFFLARYPVYMGAIVNERLGPLGSLKRSAQLTQSDSGRIVWVLVCLTILTMVVSLGLEGVLELLTGGIINSSVLIVPILRDHQVLAGQIADGLGSMILTPYMMIVVSLMYFDQRIRKEGYDMEILAAELGYPEVQLRSVFPPALTKASVLVGSRKK